MHLVLNRNDSSLFNNQLHQLINNKSSKKNGISQGVRKITQGKPNHRIIFHYSKKNQSLMPCESQLEAWFCLVLEFDKAVVKYKTQPFSLLYSNNKCYTPDFLHIDKSGNIVVTEIKFSGALQSEKTRNKLKQIKNIFDDTEVHFQIITNKQLPSCEVLKKFQYEYSRQPIYCSGGSQGEKSQ